MLLSTAWTLQFADNGEVCYSSQEISSGIGGANTLTACLVKYVSHSVEFCQWLCTESFLEAIENIVLDDAMLNGMSTTAHMKMSWGFCPIWMRLKALSHLWIESWWSSSCESVWDARLVAASVDRNVLWILGSSRASYKQSHERWWRTVLLWWPMVWQQSWSPCLPSLMTNNNRGQTSSTTNHLSPSFRGTCFKRSSKPACPFAQPAIITSMTLWKLRVVLPFSSALAFAKLFIAPERPRLRSRT